MLPRRTPRALWSTSTGGSAMKTESLRKGACSSSGESPSTRTHHRQEPTRSGASGRRGCVRGREGRRRPPVRCRCHPSLCLTTGRPSHLYLVCRQPCLLSLTPLALTRRPSMCGRSVRRPTHGQLRQRRTSPLSTAMSSVIHLERESLGATRFMCQQWRRNGPSTARGKTTSFKTRAASPASRGCLSPSLTTWASCPQRSPPFTRGPLPHPITWTDASSAPSVSASCTAEAKRRLAPMLMTTRLRLRRPLLTPSPMSTCGWGRGCRLDGGRRGLRVRVRGKGRGRRGQRRAVAWSSRST
mmetsp:Transcript_25448/g.73510  ORF Transcript_25448/g.73510 Transcript_25448/m.73510 type:complete len:299 (+) Transcript_25448:205-1101(+)